MCHTNTHDTVEGRPLNAVIAGRMAFRPCQVRKMWQFIIRHRICNMDIQFGTHKRELLRSLNWVWPGNRMAEALWPKAQDKLRAMIKVLLERGHARIDAGGVLHFSTGLNDWTKDTWDGDITRTGPLIFDSDDGGTQEESRSSNSINGGEYSKDDSAVSSESQNTSINSSLPKPNTSEPASWHTTSSEGATASSSGNGSQQGLHDSSDYQHSLSTPPRKSPRHSVLSQFMSSPRSSAASSSYNPYMAPPHVAPLRFPQIVPPSPLSPSGSSYQPHMLPPYADPFRDHESTASNASYNPRMLPSFVPPAMHFDQHQFPLTPPRTQNPRVLPRTHSNPYYHPHQQPVFPYDTTYHIGLAHMPTANPLHVHKGGHFGHAPDPFEETHHLQQSPLAPKSNRAPPDDARSIRSTQRGLAGLRDSIYAEPEGKAQRQDQSSDPIQRRNGPGIRPRAWSRHESELEPKSEPEPELVPFSRPEPAVRRQRALRQPAARLQQQFVRAMNQALEQMEMREIDWRDISEAWMETMEDLLGKL